MSPAGWFRGGDVLIALGKVLERRRGRRHPDPGTGRRCLHRRGGVLWVGTTRTSPPRSGWRQSQGVACQWPPRGMTRTLVPGAAAAFRTFFPESLDVPEIVGCLVWVGRLVWFGFFGLAGSAGSRQSGRQDPGGITSRPCRSTGPPERAWPWPWTSCRSSCPASARTWPSRGSRGHRPACSGARGRNHPT